MQTEPTKAAPQKRKRRWFQFSLRWLLIFTLICAIPCGWLGRRIERKRKERESVRSIEVLGGHIWYDYETFQANAGGPRPGPLGPAFLRTLLGDDFFSEVDGVVFEGVRDADLENLKGFHQLQTLSLNNCEVTDSGLASLKMFSQLRHLSLAKAQITDAGLKQIENLTQLQSLALIDTQVTDAGLAKLKVFTGLRSLDLSGTRITDAGLVNLKGMAELDELILLWTNVTDAGVSNLKRLKQLRSLYLTGTKLTNAGMEELRRSLPNCRILD